MYVCALTRDNCVKCRHIARVELTELKFFFWGVEGGGGIENCVIAF